MATPEITEAPTGIPSRHPQPSAELLRPQMPPARRLHPLVPALASGGLAWLCYFPADCGWLAWVALVPLLTLVRSPARPRTVYVSAWVGGLVFFGPALQWLRVADSRMYFTWAFLACYCALYFPLALSLIRFLDHRLHWPLVVTVPVVWTALELLRSHFGTGFSWYLLGHSQHDFLPLIQISDFTGVYGLTFLIAAVNALCVEFLYDRRRFSVWISPRQVRSSHQPGAPATRQLARSRRWRSGLVRIFRADVIEGLVVLVALGAALSYGWWRLGEDRLTEGPQIALIQGNLDQRIRNDSSFQEEAARSMANHFIDLSDLAADLKPELIVWPETSYPVDWVENTDGAPTDGSAETARRMIARWETNLLLGMNSTIVESADRRRRYNSAVLIDRSAHAAGRYDKIHRVPFGEYVPLRDWLPWMNTFAPYDFDYSVWPGRRYTRFTLAGKGASRSFSFGALICYEDTDPAVARPYGGGDGERPVDFLINISNDGWFNGTSEHDQHLAICRFRAVEARRSVARSVNMGISALIDSNGRVLAPHRLPAPASPKKTVNHVWAVGEGDAQGRRLPVSDWPQYKKVAGVLLATIPIDDRTSLYSRWGDWLPWTCWAVLAAGIVLGIRRRRAPAPSPT
jgi:apolipoprotein N-acyltransferase